VQIAATSNALVILKTRPKVKQNSDLENVIDRLLCELRRTNALLKTVENEISRCGPDFHLMGLVGAIRALKERDRALSEENRRLKKDLNRLIHNKK